MAGRFSSRHRFRSPRCRSHRYVPPCCRGPFHRTRPPRSAGSRMFIMSQAFVSKRELRKQSQRGLGGILPSPAQPGDFGEPAPPWKRLRKSGRASVRPAVAQPGRSIPEPKASGCSGQLSADAFSLLGHRNRSVVGSKGPSGPESPTRGTPLPTFSFDILVWAGRRDARLLRRLLRKNDAAPSDSTRTLVMARRFIPTRGTISKSIAPH